MEWMRRFAGEMGEHRQELVRLDTAIGDGDHGTNMDRGMRKALEKLDGAEQADPGTVLKTVAMALVSSVGGAAGPLYGTLFLQMGTALAGQDLERAGGYLDEPDVAAPAAHELRLQPRRAAIDWRRATDARCAPPHRWTDSLMFG